MLFGLAPASTAGRTRVRGSQHRIAEPGVPQPTPGAPAAPRWWSRLLDGARRWGFFDATVGQRGVRRCRLIIYPPRTSTADWRLARLWQGWPISGAVLGLLAVMLLGKHGGLTQYRTGARRGRLREYRRCALPAGRTRPRASQVHVDRPHARRRRPALASQVRRMANPRPHADSGRPYVDDRCDLIGRA